MNDGKPHRRQLIYVKWQMEYPLWLMLLPWQMLLPYRLEEADVIAFVADIIATRVIILVLVLCC